LIFAMSPRRSAYFSGRAHKASRTDPRGGPPKVQPEVKIPDPTCADY
jgi:hypothetical protein